MNPEAREEEGFGVLGVVVLHEPDGEVATLRAVRDLHPQVEDLLLIHNGAADDQPPADGIRAIKSLKYQVNVGTAAAWNAALAMADCLGYKYLYVLDQDSVPSEHAVETAVTAIRAPGIAAVVQPTERDRLHIDAFPWNTVASGALLAVRPLLSLGGFDERLFVDEADHEAFARLIKAGYGVRPLDAPTIDHRTGSPRPIRFFGHCVVTSGHSVERRGLQGFSAGLLVRRYARAEPATAARLLARHALTAAKAVAAGERDAAGALLSGLAAGAAVGEPPARAAERSCPYCEGPLLGRFGAVVDWRYGTGVPGDVYRCAACGALAAGRVPSSEEVASWYDRYYTHAVEPARRRIWSKVWPTPRRRRETEQLRWYFADLGRQGRFLDVGTGTGERLVQFAEAGWTAVGQDLDPKAGAAARERGLTVHGCPLGDLLGREAPFDVIGLSHVLEHAIEPAELLRECAGLLAPGGRLCVVSPNADSLGRRLFGRWWYGLEQPRHLAIPTLESLSRVTAGLGLETERLTSGAANGAVILGASLSRPVLPHVPDGRARAATAFALHCLGQGMGRAATRLDHRLGEEVIWVGRRRP